MISMSGDKFCILTQSGWLFLMSQASMMVMVNHKTKPKLLLGINQVPKNVDIFPGLKSLLLLNRRSNKIVVVPTFWQLKEKYYIVAIENDLYHNKSNNNQRKYNRICIHFWNWSNKKSEYPFCTEYEIDSHNNYDNAIVTVIVDYPSKHQAIGYIETNKVNTENRMQLCPKIKIILINDNFGEDYQDKDYQNYDHDHDDQRNQNKKQKHFLKFKINEIKKDVK